MPRPLDTLDEIRRLMDEGGIAPTPSNYDFCHRYVTHSDHDVWVAVAEEIRTNGRLSPDALARIQESVGQTNEAPGSGQFLVRVGKQLKEVDAYLKDASGEAARYGTKLKRGQSEFALVPSAGDERATKLLAELAAATDTMVAQTAALNAKLAQSTEEVSSMRRELDKARRDTMRDSLTGLPNRRAFDLQIAEAIGRSEAGAPLTVAFCDVDHFKKFNDTWGHRVGDDVLKLVGVRMIDAFQTAGFPARYGGEEFVAILPELAPSAAVALADKFRQSISARSLKMRGDGRDIGRVTISVGLATRKKGEDADSLIERADAALYRAKREGRDRVVSA